VNANLCGEFILRIYITNLYYEFILRIYITNLYYEFIWRICLMCGYAAQSAMLALVRIIGWRIRGATYVQMAQIAQRSTVFCAHTARKVGVLQMLIASELGHVLENA
jgi:hypothetical protein